MYDRYGSYEHAKKAFKSVLEYEPSFEKANEIYFRLGIIYKEQQEFANSLEVVLKKNIKKITILIIYIIIYIMNSYEMYNIII